jgi:hypothetical protein
MPLNLINTPSVAWNFPPALKLFLSLTSGVFVELSREPGNFHFVSLSVIRALIYMVSLNQFGLMGRLLSCFRVVFDALFPCSLKIKLNTSARGLLLN